MKKKMTLLMITAFVASLLVFSGGFAKADDDPNCDVTVNPGESIQDAIDAASPGDTICVEPGTYNEDLSITKSLELVGIENGDENDDDGDRPIIEGVATVPADQFPLAIPNIDILAEDVSIHGFIIKSPAVAAEEYSSGIVLAGRNNKVYDNLFFVGTGDISQGIQTYRQDNAPEGLRDISGLKIYNNRFTNLEPATGLGAYEGIFINPQSDEIGPSDQANRIIIEKNRFFGRLIRAITTQRSGTVIEKNRMATDWTPADGLETFPRGIQLSKAGAAPPLPGAESIHHWVAKNRIDDKGAAAFYTGILVRDEVTDSTIAKNFLIRIANSGMELGDSDSNTISKNFIIFSGNDGLFVNGDDNLLEKNFILLSGANGIHMGGLSEGNDVKKNRIRKSGGFDILDEGTDNDFVKNRCETSNPEGRCQ